MGRSHHDQVRPVLREARLAILRLLRRPRVGYRLRSSGLPR